MKLARIEGKKSIQSEEGFEVVFLVEDVGGGATESKEKEDQTHDSTLRASLLDRNRSTLESGEGRSVFLDLGLSSQPLRGHLLVSIVLQLQLVL